MAINKKIEQHNVCSIWSGALACLTSGAYLVLFLGERRLSSVKWRVPHGALGIEGEYARRAYV